MWCEQEVDLFWCDAYDKTGFWSGDEKMKPTWRLWEGEDLWETSEFSCARGMSGYNNNDDENQDNQNNQDDNVENSQQYLDSSFGTLS